MSVSFVHLRLHSEFSLIDGLVRIKPLVKQVAESGMPAVALTDHTNFYALIKFYKAAVGAGVKPIYGSDFHVMDDNDETQISTLCLLAHSLPHFSPVTRALQSAAPKFTTTPCSALPRIMSSLVIGMAMTANKKE